MLNVVKDDSDESLGTDEEWTALVDRGGLWRIRENTYHLFCALEEVVQLELKSLAQHSSPKRSK